MKRAISVLFVGLLFVSGCSLYSYEDLEDKPKRLEAVDLGLPSGTLWASHNLGARHYYDLGDKYAWGETHVKNSEYSLLVDGSLTAYNSYEEFGAVDNRYILDPEDDAASVSLGEDWRMPTRWEFEELVDYCTASKTRIKGECGYILTSRVNSKQIFIPGIEGREVIGYYIYSAPYWTSCAFQTSNGSFSAEKADLAYYYGEGHLFDPSNKRSDGNYIRPVFASRAKLEGVAFMDPTLTIALGTLKTNTLLFTPVNTLDRRLVCTTSDDKVAHVDAEGNIYALYPGTAHIVAKSVSTGISDEMDVVVESVVPELVDLGLPSGNLWADRNLGATPEHEIGLFFAWGETHSKAAFNRDNYNGVPSSKLQSSASYILSAEEDAATMILGDGWRIPTSSDFMELIENCTLKSEKGKCMLISKINGNVLSLPADIQFSDFSSYPYCPHNMAYWTSSRQENKSPDCLFLKNLSGVLGGFINNTVEDYIGLAIRPVFNAAISE